MSGSARKASPKPASGQPARPGARKPRDARSAPRRPAGAAGGSARQAHAAPRPVAAPATADGPLLRVPPDVIEAGVSAVLRLDGPADLVLRGFFREHAYLGRRDRGVVAETVFDVLRHRRLYAHLAQGLGGSLARACTRLSILRRFGDAAVPGLDVPAPLLEALQRVLTIDPQSLAQAIRLSLPDWLHAELLQQATAATAMPTVSTESDGAVRPPAEATAPDAMPLTPEQRVERLGQVLLQPAPLDLRVNVLKADRTAALAALHEAGIDAVPLDVPATAIRVQGKPALERVPAFEQGWFEVQDAGSQRLVEFAAPKRGQTVVDFCAGAGGKTLALAGAMRSSGQIYACDVSAARLQRLRPRLTRSGATNVQPFGLDSERDPKLKRLAGRADLVLVDAPCSGTGTLRRNPELKWRMQSQDIDALSVLQSSILAAAAALVKPGGTLVYATCSLLHRENEAVVEAFDAERLGFDAPQFLRLHPDEVDTDGFFAARWVRMRRPAVK